MADANAVESDGQEFRNPRPIDAESSRAEESSSADDGVGESVGNGSSVGWAAWKSALAPLVDPQSVRKTHRSAGASEHGALTPLAVLFELREPSQRHRGPWQSPAASTIAASPGRTDNLRLAVRPAIRSTTGRWVTSGVSWGSLYHQVHRLNLDDKQVAWFGQFSALGRTAQGLYFGQDPERLVIDDFASSLIWQLFSDARRLGIALVSNKKDGSIRVGEQARIGLDIARVESSSLRLEPTVQFDGRRVSPAAVGTIGDHGLYVVEFAPKLTVTLAPAETLAEGQIASLLHRDVLTIPAADVDEFMTRYYPTLERRLGLRSANASFDFPEIVTPLLVGTAKFEDGDVLSLSWEWEYRFRESSTRLAVGDRSNSSENDLRRDRDTEDETEDRLRRDVASIDWEDDPPPTFAEPHFDLLAAHTWLGIDAARVSERLLRVLEQSDGVRIDFVGERPDYHELDSRPTLTVRTVETDQWDWFDLGILVQVDGHSIPFGPLFKALTKGESRLLLIDKTFLSLKQPVFDRLRELIQEAGVLAEWETGPRISRYQASLWSDFEDLADESEPAASWRDSVGNLLQLLEDDKKDAESAVPIANEDLPRGLNATLRPYQIDGYRWLAFLWQHQLGGILADDMGLGKTIQTLALLAHAVEKGEPRRTGEKRKPERRPFLVVAPTSVVPNWAAEAERFTPDLRVVQVNATWAKSGGRLGQVWAEADLVITSYALFRLDFDEYDAQEWAGLILDEAQFVKNHTARAHQCARDLRAPFKLAVTGTPLENNLMELWSLFDIVAPGLFASSRRFIEQYVRPVQHDRERGDSAKLIDRLRRRVRPLMLRRTKESVARELPPKQEQVLRIDLAPAHRRLYDTFLQKERQKLLGLIEDLDRNRFTVFRSLTLLRMLSLDASLIDDEYARIPSSKLDSLFEQLDDVISEGHRALVFSQFTSFLRKVSDRLDAKGINYSYLDGSTRRRADVVRGFKTGNDPVFLISLKAGGVGLNLTEADYVFLLDPWWNPASEMQAIDRAHRIGQDKRVVVYRMVSADTIEEKVLALGERKSRLFDAVMNADGAFNSALTADDIRRLIGA